MLDRSTAPDKQPMLPFVDRRGEASVRVSAGNAPVADERVMEGVVEVGVPRLHRPARRR
jgi:hypothetical protein